MFTLQPRSRTSPSSSPYTHPCTPTRLPLPLPNQLFVTVSERTTFRTCCLTFASMTSRTVSGGCGGFGGGRGCSDTASSRTGLSHVPRVVYAISDQLSLSLASVGLYSSSALTRLKQEALSDALSTQTPTPPQLVWPATMMCSTPS